MALEKYSIGIDEVGRGPLAGPITVCAALFPRHFPFKKYARLLDIPFRDSKKLTSITRKNWASFFRSHPSVSYVLANVSVETIDRINITQAALQAVDKALLKLAVNHKREVANAKIFLDGGLYVSKRTIKKIHIRAVPCAIIKGDEKIPAISAASIIAKVTRDRFMARMAKKYSGYGFARHKGYGTKAHIAAIRKLGISAIHRRSFLKNL